MIVASESLSNKAWDLTPFTAQVKMPPLDFGRGRGHFLLCPAHFPFPGRDVLDVDIHV